MKGILCVALAVVLFCIAVNAEKTKWNQLKNYNFEKYVKEYNKKYSLGEYEQRKAIFEERLARIQEHNNNPNVTYKKGINHLSDRSDEEFKTLLGYKKSIAYSREIDPSRIVSFDDADVSALPKHVDWREKGVVTAVKDQGQCGSCWSFGTAETVESYFALATGHLVDLSEQQILDCTPNPDQCGGLGGCQGGVPEIAYAKIMQLGGLSTEWQYPYISYWGNNFQCQLSNTSNINFVAHISDYKVLPSNQVTPVLTALANVGPLAVNVDASAWSEYESGVFDGCNQTNPDIDHVVQLVGYGTDPTNGDYWLVRNSWSPLWGDNGYIRLRRTDTPRCGVDLHPQDGTGCKNGPPQVTVCGTCGILYDVSYPIVH